MIIHKINLLLSLAVAVTFVQCDFPPDPPLKTDNPTSNPVVEIDSARSLLSLRPGNRWTYVVVKDNNPASNQGPMTTIASEMMFQGEMYYDIRYLYFEKMPGGIVHGLPTLLRLNQKGISFYDRMPPDTMTISRPPKALFTLPYPASAGRIIKEPKNDYYIHVVSKDTLVQGHDPTTTFRCYRYDVRLANSRRYSIYAVPGSAFLKIEYEDLIFYTIAWRVE